MSLISIVQLSDLHMSRTEDNSIYSKVDLLSSSLISQLRHSKRIIVIFNGDAANRGTPDEFDEAYYFLENLKLKLSENLEGELETFLVPGNHDCFFEQNSTRDKLLDDIDYTSTIFEEDSFRNVVMHPLNNYRNFEELFDENPNYISRLDNGYIKVWEDQSESVIKVNLNLLNSAWCSTINENPGHMNFPLSLLENSLMYSSNPNTVTISVIHHPLHWIDPNNKRAVKNQLESKSDIIFTGHEHVSSSSIKNSAVQGRVAYIEGRVLQEVGSDIESGYNIVDIEEDKKVVVKTIDYNSDSEMYVLDESKTLNFSLDNRNKTNADKLKLKSHEKLTELKDSLKVPIFGLRNLPLELDDVFMYPMLKPKLEEDKQEVEFNDLLNKGNTVTIISGDHDSGKSSIAKQIYQDYTDKDFSPLFYEGKKLKVSNPNEFGKTIKKIIKVNYGEELEEYYNQLPSSQKILIIDNWGESQINPRLRGEFIDYVSKEFDRIFIFDSVGTNYKEHLQLSTNSESTISYYEIKEFGHQKRMEFIERWVKANHKELDDSALNTKVSILEKSLNPLLGKNIVPRYPIYILTLLKEIEKGHSAQNVSSSAYYYDILIKDLLLSIEFKMNAQTEKLNNYLIELSWFVYTSKGSISYDSWREFHSLHLQKYDLKESQLKFEEYKGKLLLSKILKGSDDNYSFTYSYVYYYFIALKLSNDITEKDAQDHIKNLLNNLNNELSNNVLLFLTHFSKNPFVVDEIVEKANSILENEKLYNCVDDEHGINSLINHVPKIDIPEKIDVRSNRIRQRKLQDEMEEEYNNDKNQEVVVVDEQSEDNQLVIDKKSSLNSKHAEINEAVRIIELMGQLLKNFYGSMQKDTKDIVAQTTFELSFKIINALFDELFKNTDTFIDSITNLIYKELANESGQDEVTQNEAEEIRKLIRKYIYAIHGGTLYSIIHKTATAIGDYELDNTFENVLESSSEYKIAFSLLKTKIEFEYYQSPSIPKISSLYSLVKENKLIAQTLQIMAKEYLYMYETSYDYKQKLLDTLNMKSTPEMLLVTSKIKN